MKIIKIDDFIDRIKCGDEYVLQTPECALDIQKVVGNSGYIKTFKNKYFKAHKALTILGKNCIQMSKTFEKLKDTNDLYSIKLFGEKNIRIVFGFIDYKGTEKAVLYNCFEEKKTKDYEKAIARGTEIQNKIIERLG